MASRNIQPPPSGGRDSILVKNLPNLLAQDLKQSLITHFDKFGTVLRISCVTKGPGKLAHLQFSSAVEATNAKRNGGTLLGCSMAIELTDKHPKTQILPARPTPRRPTTSTTGSSPSYFNQRQMTLDNIFHEASSSSASGPSSVSRERETNCNVSSRDKTEAKPKVPEFNRGSEQRSTSNSDKPVSQEQSDSNKEEKPNTCVKIEVYQPSSSQRSSGPMNERHSQAVALRNQSQCAPARTLSQILNYDVAGMKSIKTIQPSDALACKLFFNNSNNKFPLAQMWGAPINNVIMPVSIIMDEIKPGMEIHEKSLELVWNHLMYDKRNGVLKEQVQQSAEKILSQEKVLAKIAPVWYNRLEEDAINDALYILAEEEMNAENDHWICIEDLLADMVGQVCRKEKSEEKVMELCSEVVDEIIESVSSDMIEEMSTLIFDTSNAIAKASKNAYAKLERQVVRNIVKDEARREFFSVLYSEILDDFLESSYFDSCVRDVVVDFMKTNSKNMAVDLVSQSCSKQLELQVVDNIVKEEARNEFINELCTEVLDDLLDSYYFKICVEITVEDFLKTNHIQLNANKSALAPTMEDSREESEDAKTELATRSSTGLFGSFKRKAVEYLGWSWPFKKQKKS